VKKDGPLPLRRLRLVRGHDKNGKNPPYTLHPVTFASFFFPLAMSTFPVFASFFLLVVIAFFTIGLPRNVVAISRH
jgi:hypothetical protein